MHEISCVWLIHLKYQMMNGEAFFTSTFIIDYSTFNTCLPAGRFL